MNTAAYILPDRAMRRHTGALCHNQWPKPNLLAKPRLAPTTP
ncbi:hypothetical protein A2U01_0097118, partial [Trifolium medium]|nr:hypothetical protein [Trifolium medium]